MCFLMENSEQDLLDIHLLGETSATVAEGFPLHPYSINKQMKHLVSDNFLLMRVFEDNFNAFSNERSIGGTIEDIIFGNFQDLFKKVVIISICKWIL